MSEPMNLNQLNKFLGDNYRISYNTYSKVLKEADSNDGNVDGVADETVFMDALKNELNISDDTWKNIQLGYVNAFNNLAGYDGQEGISYKDFSSEAENLAGAIYDANYANTVEYQNRDNKTPVALQGIDRTEFEIEQPIYSNNLTTKSVDDLRAERAAISDRIQAERDAMESAKADKEADVAQKEADYNQELDNVNEYVAAKEAELTEDENAYKTAVEDKDKIAGEITTQKDVVDTLSTSVTAQRTALTSIDSQLSEILTQEPQIGDYTKEQTNENGETEVVNDPSAFSRAHEEWKAKKDRLDAEKIAAQDLLSQYEQELGDAENALAVLEQDKTAADQAVKDAFDKLAQSDSGAAQYKENLDAKYDAWQQAKSDLQGETKPFEANIAQLQQNLSSYDTAIEQSVNQNSLELEAGNKEGVERLGAFNNTKLDAETSANNSDILNFNAQTLENDEQKEYLEEYLGADLSGEEWTENGNYFSKVNEDGTKDCFRVVNDNGNIKLIHTNIPAEGDASTEVYGVDPLKDADGNDRTYSQYASNKDGVLNKEQISNLTEELKGGTIPEDVDLTQISAHTMRSLISEYDNAEEFIENCINADLSEEELLELQKNIQRAIDSFNIHEIDSVNSDGTIGTEEAQKVLSAYHKLQELTGVTLTRGENGDIIEATPPEGEPELNTNGYPVANSMRAPTSVKSDAGAGYFDQFKGYIEATSVDGSSYNPTKDTEQLVSDILNDESLPLDEAMDLIEYIGNTTGISINVNTKDSAYVDFMQRAAENKDNLQAVIDFQNIINNSEGITIKNTYSRTVASGGYSGTYFDSASRGKYVDFVIKLYENAQSQEDIKKINEAFPDLASDLQAQYMLGDEDTKINELFTAIESNPSYTSTAAEETAWKDEYGNAGNSTTFRNIIKNKENFSNPNNYIKALMWACGNDTNKFSDYFRDLGGGDQEKYLPIILQAFGGSWSAD